MDDQNAVPLEQNSIGIEKHSPRGSCFSNFIKKWWWAIIIFCLTVGVAVFLFVSNMPKKIETSRKITSFLSQKYGNYNYEIINLSQKEECHSCPEGAMCAMSGCTNVCSAQVKTDFNLWGLAEGDTIFDVNCNDDDYLTMSDDLISKHYLEQYAKKVLRKFQNINSNISAILNVELEHDSSLSALSSASSMFSAKEIEERIRKDIGNIRLRYNYQQGVDNLDQLNSFLSENIESLKKILVQDEFPSARISISLDDNILVYEDYGVLNASFHSKNYSCALLNNKKPEVSCNLDN